MNNLIELYSAIIMLSIGFLVIMGILCLIGYGIWKGYVELRNKWLFVTKVEKMIRCYRNHRKEIDEYLLEHYEKEIKE